MEVVLLGITKMQNDLGHQNLGGESPLAALQQCEGRLRCLLNVTPEMPHKISRCPKNTCGNVHRHSQKGPITDTLFADKIPPGHGCASPTYVPLGVQSAPAGAPKAMKRLFTPPGIAPPHPPFLAVWQRMRVPAVGATVLHIPGFTLVSSGEL